MQQQISTFFQYSDYNLFIVSTHNPILVILSILIAILASFMGFQVASQAKHTTPARKSLLLLIGSIALGGGVWSMHFIGMLALELCTSVSYQFELTTLSILPAVAASWVALNLLTNHQIQRKQLVYSGVLVGSGIGTMHYVGMAAMEMAPLLRYDLPLFILSIIVAISLAILALWISFGLDKKASLQYSKNTKLTISSCVMGAAIAGMHYTGMLAARFVLPPGIELSQQSSNVSTLLVLGVTTITVVIIFLVLGINLIIRYKDISATATNNERRLLATMDTAIDGIITIDAERIIISVNNAVSTLLGWQPEELIGNNVKMLVPVPFQHNHDQYVDNYLQTREAKIIGKGREVEALCKSGEKIPVRLGIGHVELNNQHMFVAFISDLRERKAMENTLRKKESKIRSLVTNIPGIAYRCIDRPGWPNIFINDEVEKILGYPAEDFLLPYPKRSIADFVHPEDMPTIAQTNFRHTNGFQLEFRVIDRNSKVKWVLGHGRSSKDENSEDYFLDGFIMDITDRKKMESALIAEKEKAEQAAATRAAFLANMSHEIRTPMNAIIGFSDILLDEELSIHQRKQLNTINQSAKSLLHILNDILDSAKLDKGKFQLEYRDFSLVEEVDSVVSTLWLQAQHKNLDINLNIEKNIQRFYHGAPDRLRQVLTNLIGNAIKFTEQGHVDIAIKSESEGFLTFAISDTGIGMTQQQLAAIFDAFAQADESMSRRFGGTGLGTTISKQLVELMGGTISASSEFGKGSTFTFTLPVKIAIASTTADKKQDQVLLPQLSVLIVDDIEQNIDLLSLILKRHGHVISVARNGEQALLKMESEGFDVVLMDIQMPVMDGLTATEQRRTYEAENGLARLPIIALTASVLPQDKKSAQLAGMDGFASKPIDIRQLIGEIAKTIIIEQVDTSPKQPVSTQKATIDLEKGIDLWGSKTTLFHEIINFLNKSEHELCSLVSLVQSNDWSKLEDIAHKYKGVAGNLALNQLMLAFTELEQITRKHKQSDALLLIETVQDEVDAISKCAQKMSSKTHKKVQSKLKAISKEQLLNTLLTLQKYVTNNEFDDDLLDTLQANAAGYDKQVTPIIIACNDFDFDLASSHIKAFIDSLRSNI
ncbi:MHYT domain-containing protein [Psychromonas sp. SR45-3]|uniref:MHYT domain-containing protein n=2 Tax=Alteromonadales TaxID=135622 RepID=UPI0015FC31FB|nr:MHYT domain-containing protein [Psychromonas sp. SR45-3]MBB1273282.1 PAS domain S-box protein [Psychromonas sp. SR45-3]